MKSPLNPSLLTLLPLTQTRQKPRSGRITISYLNRAVMFSTDEVMWLEGASNYTYIHTRDNGRYIIAKTLKKYEQELNGDLFLRAHKSAIVNLMYVESAQLTGKAHLRLIDGQTILISRRRAVAIRNRLENLQPPVRATVQ